MAQRGSSMARKSRDKIKGRRTTGNFALVPEAVINSVAYSKLSWPARALLLEVAVQYRGFNNGDQACAHAIHRGRGWQRSTLQKATQELESGGFLVRTRQGGRNRCNLYGLTWQALDECPGKGLDHGYPTKGGPLSLWMKLN